MKTLFSNDVSFTSGSQVIVKNYLFSWASIKIASSVACVLYIEEGNDLQWKLQSKIRFEPQFYISML